MSVDLKTQNINNVVASSEVSIPTKVQVQPTLKYEPDVVTISGKDNAKNKNKNVLGMLLAGISAAGMLTLLIVNKKRVGEILGFAKNEGKTDSSVSTSIKTEVDEIISKVEKGENIIEKEASSTPASAPAPTSTSSHLAENISKSPEKATFTEIPNPNIPAEVPLPFPSILDTATPLGKTAGNSIADIVNKEIAGIEANSANPYEVLISYYNKAANVVNKEEKDVISLITGQKLIDNYQSKLVDTKNFARVAENLANLHYKKGNLNNAEKLLNLVVKNSDNSVQNADLYEQLAVIAQKTGKRDKMKSNYINAFKERMKMINDQHSIVIKSTNNSERLMEQGDLMRLGRGLKSFYERVSSKGVEVPYLKDAITYLDGMDLRGVGSFSRNWADMIQKIN